MTENQFKIEFDGHRYFLVIDEVNERCLARLDTMSDVRAWLEIYEMLSDDNNQLVTDNFELQGLLGDVRALLRLNKVDDAIDRIDKFERSMKK